MKLMKFFTILAAGLMLLTSCAGDDAPDMPKDNADFFKALTRGEASVSYKLASFEAYDKEYAVSDKYEKLNLEDWVGWELPAPGVITIHEGKTWSPLVMFTEVEGPVALSFPLEAYRQKTGFSKRFYVACPFEYDDESNEVTIGEKRYEKVSVNEEELVVNYISQYWKGGVEGVAGEWKWVLTYEKSALSLPDMEKILFYDSEYDAFMAILEMLRAEFGDEVNVNDYLSQWVILDEPVFNFDEIESRIKAKYHRE